MRGKLSFALLFSGLLSICLFQDNNLYAKDTLEDGIIGLTKEAVREKFGKPPYLYCEEEPHRRYVIVKPENEIIVVSAINGTTSTLQKCLDDAINGINPFQDLAQLKNQHIQILSSLVPEPNSIYQIIEIIDLL